MKIKLNTTLPTVEEITRGLTPHDVHPPLASAEKNVADRERDLEQRRKELAALERRVEQLPADIQAGRAPTGELIEAMRKRDAAAMLVAPAEKAVTAARDKLEAERRIAKGLVVQEFLRREAPLVAAAAELAPVLAEINRLAIALSKTRGDGGVLALGWPDSLQTQMERAAQGLGPADHGQGPAS